MSTLPVDPQGRSGGLEKRAAPVEITDDDGATSDFARAGATSRTRAAGPDSPIPASGLPGGAFLRGREVPPIKPEGGREKTTAGFAVRSLNRSDTPGIAGLSNHVR